MWFRRIGYFGLVTLLLAGCLTAQSPNGIINGLVLDPTGGAIAGAEIRIANDATGVQYTGKTNGEGIYVVTNLPPGPYRLQVSKIGFKTLIKPDIILNVQDSLAINFTLPVGAASEIVTVTGGAPLVNTESGSVSTVIDRNFVESLPLNGRSFNTLLQLTPGVVIAPSNNIGGNPGQFSIAGQRTDSNNFTVDGVSANFGVSLALNGVMGAAGTGSAQAFSVLGGTSSLVSVEALQEFRIETSSFAPEFGRQSGGQVILSTRSGGNDFHGGAYDYFRNTVMDANDWFADDAGNPRAPEHHNDFGGFLGGPIWKDRTFFFASYEGARLDLPATQVIQVPYTGVACTPPSSIAPFLAAYPRANGPVSTSDCTGQFTGTYSNRATLNAGSARIDHTFNDHISVFGRFNDAPSQSLTRTLSLSTFDTSTVDTKTLTIGVNMVFSPSVSNTVRGNYSRQNANTIEALDSFGGATPLDPSLLLGSLSPANAHGEFYTFDTNNLEIGPLARSHATQLNFVDDLSLSVGLHQLKFGGDYRAIFTTTAPAVNYLSYGADSVQSFLSSEQATLFASTTATARFLSQSFSLFAQDTWKLNSRLTLTYGLRWELSPAPSPRGNTVLASWENVNTPSLISLARQGTPLWKTTYDNFAPRVGIAYSLTDNGDFVLRAGAGIFYDLGVGASANTALAFPNDAALLTPTVSLPVGDVTPFLPALSLQPPYSGTIYAFSPNLRLPRSYQWNLALEKSFGKSQAVSLTYVGQSGHNLLRNEGLVSPTADFSPDTTFYLTLNDATSSYNALQVQYRRPLSSRLQALLNYSWSHSLDDTSDDTVSTISNTIFSNKDDWGSSAFDVRQSVSGALHFDIPSTTKDKLLSALTRSWSLDSVVVARTGFPFNAVLLTLGTVGGVYPRPDLVPGQPFWIPTAGAPGGKVLNPAAFIAPPALEQGDEGRNDIKGFGLTQVDLSAGRKFPITERLNLQFRADAFNLFNHPNFANPAAYIGFGPAYLESQHMLNQALGGLNPLFQEGGPRSIQLSLRLTF